MSVMPEPALSVTEKRARSQSALVHPLDFFYALSGLQLPSMDVVEPDAVPQPYRGLLVHTSDMTSTLENFHGSSVHLRLLRREKRGDEYFREVILLLEKPEKAVEFGAIKINLPRFPREAREQILQEHWPLGRILRTFNIAYRSRPAGFLRVSADSLISDALHVPEGERLFGRRNNLLDLEDHPLAEIVEILPPATES